MNRDFQRFYAGEQIAAQRFRFARQLLIGSANRVAAPPRQRRGGHGIDPAPLLVDEFADNGGLAVHRHEMPFGMKLQVAQRAPDLRQLARGIGGREPRKRALDVEPQRARNDRMPGRVAAGQSADDRVGAGRP